ncbi:MAG TPA: Uma2 family endonuclease [Chthoniobacterales bacterium]
MTAVTEISHWISPEEYLEGELLSEVRHEYLGGNVYAMAGTSTDHNRIAGNIFSRLHGHLESKLREPFMNDMKAHLRLNDEDWFYYPDVMVNCDPRGQHKYYCDTPSVVFEVLSPATERTDRREKRIAYEAIPQLHTYVLVAQDVREVTIYRRSGADWKHWAREILPENGQTLRIPELDFSISMDAIYQRTAI